MDENENNPYAPPATEIQNTVEEAVHAYPEATAGKRFFNFIIDRAAVYGVAMLVGLALALLEGTGLIVGWVDQIGKLSPLEDILFTALLASIYYVGCEATFGRTLGKLITGTKVINYYGGKPSFGAILGRTLSRLVPFDPLSFLVSNNGGWHDRWSSTQVVDLRKKAAVPPLRPHRRSY